MSRQSFLVVCGLIGCVSLWAAASAQPRQPAAKAVPDPAQERLVALAESVRLAEESLAKRADEEVLFRRLADLAEVDKVRYAGPPPRVIKNLTAQGAGNPVILTAYTFFPRKRPTGAKLPLVVLVHGGVHGNFNSGNVHVLRELLAQGYAVVAPDYRGSSGYGQEFRQLIDYGGPEVEDVFAGKQWALENHRTSTRSASASWAGATAG
jgi:dipeptidyl aminopeptidase/acylaminoacyl peptidase